jgi:16S rRNA (guanine(527)-N(7))-methyltransferase GidB
VENTVYYDFAERLRMFELTLTPKQERQFKQYYELLIEWNEKMNLTAITEVNEVYQKHFFDSITPIVAFDFLSIQTLCDVGSGAGFPAFVLKIIYPHLQITIVEALAKRLNFLNYVANALEFTDVTLIHERAEIYGQKNREKFDVVIARAVARLPMLSELCVPLVKVNGTFIAMKGEQGVSEYRSAIQALKTLGISEVIEKEFYLNNQSDKRLILYCAKTKKTPITYPRQFSKIKNQSL